MQWRRIIKGIVVMKKVLITGANSYIGTNVERWLLKENSVEQKYSVDTLDMMNAEWNIKDFSEYDVVFHVAGIAHADVGTVSEEQKQLYYKINTDLTINVAEKAKAEGVKQFIFMSSMIVYSDCKEKIITKETTPNPVNFYGDSKWQADKAVQQMNTENFKVVVIRPPMIYGKGSKGNYPKLAKIATKLPLFPVIENRRSILYIENLCQFIKLMIDNEEVGVFFPQNNEYTRTSDMVKLIADAKGHRIVMTPSLGLGVKLIMKFPGKIGILANKAFGDFAYEMSISEYKDNYRVCGFKDSIHKAES